MQAVVPMSQRGMRGQGGWQTRRAGSTAAWTQHRKSKGWKGRRQPRACSRLQAPLQTCRERRKAQGGVAGTGQTSRGKGQSPGGGKEGAGRGGGGAQRAPSRALGDCGSAASTTKRGSAMLARLHTCAQPAMSARQPCQPVSNVSQPAMPAVRSQAALRAVSSGSQSASQPCESASHAGCTKPGSIASRVIRQPGSQAASHQTKRHRRRRSSGTAERGISRRGAAAGALGPEARCRKPEAGSRKHAADVQHAACMQPRR